MKEGVSFMSKFCSSCGTTLKESAKSDLSPAYQLAGEFTLSSELIPTDSGFVREGLMSLLKSCIKGLVSSFKRSLRDKKRLGIVIAFGLIWLFINILVTLDFFPLPVRVLSWLTAARGSLIGGSIGKGIVVALFSQIIVDKGVFQSLKNGLGQLYVIVKDNIRVFAPLLMGIGVSLIACNFMVSSYIQNTMVCVASFLLSAKSLESNGFLLRLCLTIFPKANSTAIMKFIGGWTIGFLVFTAVSILPGGKNGYVFGILIFIVACVLLAVSRNKKEAEL